jgi:hypothetical protein
MQHQFLPGMSFFNRKSYLITIRLRKAFWYSKFASYLLLMTPKKASLFLVEFTTALLYSYKFLCVSVVNFNVIYFSAVKS